jgi:hypothetical protein
MPEKPRPTTPKFPIFRPRDYDRYEIERAREVIRFAKKVLAESDPSILLARQKADRPSGGQSDPPSESQ